MATTPVDAEKDARRDTEGRPIDQFLERLVERIGGHAGVQAVFGEPIQRGDLTVVPVARVRWGFGGGMGSAGDAAGAPGGGSGSGGGGGVAADAVGFLEIGPDGATFRPIAQPYPSPLFLLATAMSAAIVVRALGRLIRG